MSAALFLEIGFIIKKLEFVRKLDMLNVHIKLVLIILLMYTVYNVSIMNGKVNIALGIYENVFFYYFTSIFGSLCIILISNVICIKNNVFQKILSFYGRNSLSLFATHSLFLYLYAKLTSLILGRKYYIMQNLDFSLCILGTIFTLTTITFIPKLYKITFEKIISKGIYMI